jgi:hypothetical protein
LVLELRQPSLVEAECGDVTIEGLRLSLSRANLLPWRGRLLHEDESAADEQGFVAGITG